MSESTRDMTCERRVDGHLQGRLEDLRRLWRAWQTGEDSLDDLGCLPEYGLAFDFIEAGTFDDQREAYFRWQLSWGGPGDEFRFFAGPDLSCCRIEYWFLDWFDGAGRVLTGDDDALLLELWEWFHETGSTESCR